VNSLLHILGCFIVGVIVVALGAWLFWFVEKVMRSLDIKRLPDWLVWWFQFTFAVLVVCVLLVFCWLIGCFVVSVVFKR
jgi:uncharacterized membrane protein YidH (DUF202 family)